MIVTCISIIDFFLEWLYSKSSVPILLMDKNYVVVDKPPDLVINDDDPGRDSLYRRLGRQFPNLVNYNTYKHGFPVLHRLDFSTSGIMVIPLTKKFASIASKALQNNSNKYYTALLRGLPSMTHFMIKLPIHEIDRFRVSTVGNGRHAETRIIVISKGVTKDGYPATLVLIKLLTGRRHQIRAHCSAMGHSIVGDYTYSNKKDIIPERMFLHSCEMTLKKSDGTLLLQAKSPPFDEDSFYYPHIHLKCETPLKDQFEDDFLSWVII
ncbi:RNA pseudouridylate synthase domain-containing protein 1 [Lepeophtheirus salmonis]|nr:RNA pseudouridylate synthase domain-containing protein 1-like isoform X1 [Lepeophtheirus salmonis]